MSDQCNMCENDLVDKKSGLIIKGSDIITSWAGDLSDPFANSGNRAPMQGQVSLVICKPCLKLYLDL